MQYCITTVVCPGFFESDDMTHIQIYLKPSYVRGPKKPTGWKKFLDWTNNNAGLNKQGIFLFQVNAF